MDTLSSLRARVRALQRKLAPELALLRLRRLAEEHCLKSSVAQADRQPPPESHAFIRRVASDGFRLPSSWRSINTWSGAAPTTPSPTAKTSSAPSSPGPGITPLPGSARDESVPIKRSQ